jgi:prolyl-tRNA synthetase
MRMLQVYADFAENDMAMPVIQGEKTAGERFPGAVSTYSIEAMMQDRKALQSGTSHFLGQNFSRAQQIKFQDQQGQEVFAWTTSWGVSTRLVGGLIMTHADDDGMVIPPRLAPKHAVILPIYRSDEERSQVLQYARRLKAELEAQRFADEPLRVLLDDRDMRGGEKNWQHIKRGVPLRLEVGPRDVAADGVFLGRRDKATKDKRSVPRPELIQTVNSVLDEMQSGLLAAARRLRDEHTRDIDSLDEFRAYFTPRDEEKPEIHGGFARCHWHDGEALEQVLSELKVTIRCVPLEGPDEPGTCIFSGQKSAKRAIFAKAY